MILSWLKIKYLLIIVLITGITSTIIYQRGKKSSECIALIQTIAHPALDSIVDSIQKKLAASALKHLEITLHNAQGSVNTAHVIAQHLERDTSVRALCPIGTLATQAINQTETTRPVVISAVSSPESIGIRNNVCGVSDLTNITSLLQGVRLMLPDARNLGIMYSPAEANSVIVVKKLEDACKKEHIKLIHAGINHEGEISHALNNLAKNVDVVIIPTDNTVAAAMDLVGSVAQQHKLPVITTWPDGVTSGILGSAGGCDYAEQGNIVADMLIDILVHKKIPQELSIVYPPSNTITINRKMLQQLGFAEPKITSNITIAWKSL